MNQEEVLTRHLIGWGFELGLISLEISEKSMFVVKAKGKKKLLKTCKSV